MVDLTPATDQAPPAPAAPPASPSQDAAQAIEALIVKALEDPAKRAEIISLVREMGGNSRWAHVVKGVAFIGAGTFIAIRGMVYFDGATLIIAGAFATAGVAELASA